MIRMYTKFLYLSSIILYIASILYIPFNYICFVSFFLYDATLIYLPFSPYSDYISAELIIFITMIYALSILFSAIHKQII